MSSTLIIGSILVYTQCNFPLQKSLFCIASTTLSSSQKIQLIITIIKMSTIQTAAISFINENAITSAYEYRIDNKPKIV